MNESLRHLIKKVAKHSNQEYAERWLQMKKSPLWRDKVKAEQIAIHLQCLKY